MNSFLIVLRITGWTSLTITSLGFSLLHMEEFRRRKFLRQETLKYKKSLIDKKFIDILESRQNLRDKEKKTRDEFEYESRKYMG